MCNFVLKKMQSDTDSLYDAKLEKYPPSPLSATVSWEEFSDSEISIMAFTVLENHS